MAYDASQDKILYSTPETVVSGKNNDSQFVINIRQYGNSEPKVEFAKNFTYNGEPRTKNIRLSLEEWQLLTKYGNEIHQKLITLMNGNQ